MSNLLQALYSTVPYSSQRTLSEWRSLDHWTAALLGEVRIE
ncbi:MAG TPA: hypothetical protein V6C50_00680 [Crinalium sp.]